MSGLLSVLPYLGAGAAGFTQGRSQRRQEDLQEEEMRQLMEQRGLQIGGLRREQAPAPNEYVRALMSALPGMEGLQGVGETRGELLGLGGLLGRETRGQEGLDIRRAGQGADRYPVDKQYVDVLRMIGALVNNDVDTMQALIAGGNPVIAASLRNPQRDEQIATLQREANRLAAAQGIEPPYPNVLGAKGGGSRPKIRVPPPPTIAPPREY